MSDIDYPFSQYPKPVLLGLGVTFTILPVFVVGLRFFARHYSRTAVGLDDWCIVFALILCTAGGIAEILAAACRYIDEVITTLNLGVVKISILLFYRRLFMVKSFKIASAIMITIVAGWAASFTMAMIFQCNPPSYFWRLLEEEYPQHCIQVFVMYQGLAVSDLVLDVLVLALPIPVVVSLQLPWKTKIKVIDVFMLGSVVLGSGIARLVAFTQVINFGKHHSRQFYNDTPWYSAGPLFWIFAENAIAIIGACLPTLAPLWNRDKGSASKQWSRFKGSLKTSDPSIYNNLEDRHQQVNISDDTSLRHLVARGPAMDISTGDTPLDHRPEGGIHVQTILTTSDNV